MKILAVDDKPINNKVIELDVEEYCEDNNLEIEQFILKCSGAEAINTIVEQKNIDVVFMDIMMPIMDGLEAVEKIRSLKDEIKQPIIIMVTALNDESMKQRAKDIGANSYICKPFCNVEIAKAMEFCKIEIDKLNLDKDAHVEDDFLDFDEFDDFDDFDSFGDEIIDDQRDMMEQFNRSHKKLTAQEFLVDYPVLDYILDDIQEVQEDLDEHIENMYGGNLVSQMDYIIHTITKYINFLNTFSDFVELSTALNMLNKVLDETDIQSIDERHKDIVAEFIKSILIDLESWKEHVFVLQDAIDVFYINASLLNSCIQLETLLKESK